MLKQRLEQLKNKMVHAALRSGRNVNDIALVAVTKTVDHHTVQAAYEAGLSDFGENRVGELRYKQELLPKARWHMIGRLQTNKIKELVDDRAQPCLIHSLDRWHLAQELDKRGQALDIEVPVLLQVNIAKEPQKAGIEPAEVASFLSSLAALNNLRVWGLMTIAPILENPEEARPIFRDLANLRRRLRQTEFPHVDLKYLSMGMSQDFEVAIEEGSDMIRIGSALFH